MKLDRFVGLPYLDKGRSVEGVDCYGLLCLVYHQTLDIELASHVDRSVTSADRKAIAALIADELDGWVAIAEGHERAFDAVLIRVGRDVMHVGMVVCPGKLLHVESGETSRIEPYRTGKLRHRLAGFYRYRELNERAGPPS